MPEGKFVEIVDQNDRVIGRIERDRVHDKPVLHRSVHVWVFNSRKEIFLQKRPKTMKQYPALWDSSVGEHTEIGETYEETAQRGLKEELGIKVTKLEYVGKKAILDGTCFEFITLFRTVFDGGIMPDKRELEDGKFFSPKKAAWLIKKGKTTPFFVELFRGYMHE
ncbi:MAG: NUDIX domain-containing protein [archaeon]|nr:NUDIX domain-containing protein [archaeon]